MPIFLKRCGARGLRALLMAMTLAACSNGGSSDAAPSVPAPAPSAPTGNPTGRSFFIDFANGSDANAGSAKTTAWKRAPGMAGFAGSYVPQAGDSFIFKGGISWTASYPWVFQGGAASKPMTYTVDATWFAGSAFTAPVFDNQNADPASIGMANLTNAGHLSMNGLRFINCATPRVANGSKCLVFTNTHDVSITNSSFAAESWLTLYFVFDTSGSYANFVWTGNDFSNTASAIWFASAAPNVTMSHMVYNHNSFHDFASQLGGGVHGDGAWHGFVVPDGDTTQVMNDLQFCDNRFYGDFRRGYGTSGAMTGFFFQEGALHDALLCNNDMGFSPVQASMFDGLIVLSNGSNPLTNIKVFNNSMVNAGVNAMSAAVHITGDHGITLRNNIASGMNYPVYVETAGTAPNFSSDYNLWNGSSGQLAWGTGPSFFTYAQWQAAGRDVHSVLGSDPVWVSPPTDLHLATGSPANNAGTNLGSQNVGILSADRDGVARSATAAWDIGAYERAASP